MSTSYFHYPQESSFTQHGHFQNFQEKVFFAPLSVCIQNDCAITGSLAVPLCAVLDLELPPQWWLTARKERCGGRVRRRGEKGAVLWPSQRRHGVSKRNRWHDAVKLLPHSSWNQAWNNSLLLQRPCAVTFSQLHRIVVKLLLQTWPNFYTNCQCQESNSLQESLWLNNWGSGSAFVRTMS